MSESFSNVGMLNLLPAGRCHQFSIKSLFYVNVAEEFWGVGPSDFFLCFCNTTVETRVAKT